jgi:hypothetical protein
MDAVVGCPMITLSGFAAMIRFTVAWTDEPPADELFIDVYVEK